MQISPPADCRSRRAAKASRPADARRLPQRLGTCHRISTSSRPAVTLQPLRARLGEGRRKARTLAGRTAGLLATEAPTTGSSASANRDRTPARDRAPLAQGTTFRPVRKREVIRIWVRRPDPATRVARQPVAEMATAPVAAGRNFRRCPRDHLLNPPGGVDRSVAQRTAVHMALPAARVRKAVAIVQRAEATADPLVRHST